MTNKNYIFISYAHRDSDIVLPIIEKLKTMYYIWYDDSIIPGTEWDENIASHIESCNFFIACMSKNFLRSSNCKDELNFARDLDKKRIVIYLEPVELPSGIKMRIGRLQNIHKYQYANEDDFYSKLATSKGIAECTIASKSTANTIPVFDEDTLSHDDHIYIKKALACWIIQRNGIASISAIQRALSIGFNKAGRIFDICEKMGYIKKSPNSGSNNDINTTRVTISLKQLSEIFPEIPPQQWLISD